MGRRFIRLLDGQLQHLRQHCGHGNRRFFYDQLVVAHLLAFFNPILAGLRKIEDVFDVPAVRKRLKMPRVPKSTLADAQRLFDPQLLLPLFESLKERAAIQPHDPRLDGLTNKLLAVDGSFFAVAPRIAWAIYNHSAKNNVTQGNVRAHVHFDILRGLPDHATLTGGQASETEQLRASLATGCFYVCDRGFQQYQLLADIMAKGSDFLVRLRKTARCEPIETRPLTAADRVAGVLSDTLVRIGWRDNRTAIKQPLRVVEIAQPDKPDQPLRLLTNRFDLPAETIGVIYRHRWLAELFFRVLKSGCRVEERRFEHLGRLLACLAVYIIVAWRTLYVCRLGRSCPEVSCEAVFEPAEWKSVWRVIQRTDPPRAPPPLGEMVRLVAQLGGYVNRKRHDPPGPQTVWIGLQRMHDFAICWRLFGPDARDGPRLV